MFISKGEFFKITKKNINYCVLRNSRVKKKKIHPTNCNIIISFLYGNKKIRNLQMPIGRGVYSGIIIMRLA